MYQAKLKKLNRLIEEEVTIEIHGVEIIGFASICPYNLILNQIYLVNVGLTFLDGPEIIESNEEVYGLERIDKSYGYILSGRVSGDNIDIGNNIKITDDLFKTNSYLEGQFIKIKADRISIEFLEKNWASA